MLVFVYPNISPKVHIGSLVMFSLLFLLCIYSYCSRTSKNLNRTLHLTLIVSFVGIINAALFIGAYHFRQLIDPSPILSTAFFFGYLLTPLTWMVGIVLFPVVLKDKRPLQVLLAYFLLFVYFVLLITHTIISGKNRRSDDYDYLLKMTYVILDLGISLYSLNWGYFLLFVSLVIQYRQSVSKKIMATLIIFCIVNTASLIAEAVLIAMDYSIAITMVAYLYISFFFTDFIFSLSLYMTTICWKDIHKIDKQ